MKDLSNENIVHIQKKGMAYIQFRKLLQFPNIVHAFTLKPMDLGMYQTYAQKKKEIEQNLEVLGKEFHFSIEDICHSYRAEKEKSGRSVTILKLI